MKVTFEQLKQAMLDDGWVYSENVVPLTSYVSWDHVFTKSYKCWYKDEGNRVFRPYEHATYRDTLTTKQLYKKITKGKKMKQPTLKIKNLYPNIELPTPAYATSGSAGVDLHVVGIPAAEIVEPRQTMIVNTGIAVSIPKGYVGLITPRSGLGTKGLVLGNLTGVIDSDYRGEIILQLWNRGDTTITINNLDRVAQMLIVPVAQPIIEMVDELDSTERGDKGFGSTGQ